jgi:hypothetical protein
LDEEHCLSNYLGVNISVDDACHFHLITQPRLIDQILKEMDFHPDTKEQATPAQSTMILKRVKELHEQHKAHWEYHRIIGTRACMLRASSSEIDSFSSTNPKTSHTEAIH